MKRNISKTHRSQNRINRGINVSVPPWQSGSNRRKYPSVDVNSAANSWKLYLVNITNLGGRREGDEEAPIPSLVFHLRCLEHHWVSFFFFKRSSTAVGRCSPMASFQPHHHFGAALRTVPASRRLVSKDPCMSRKHKYSLLEVKNRRFQNCAVRNVASAESWIVQTALFWALHYQAWYRII